MDYAQQLAFFANILEQKRLVTALEGNASIIDRETGLTYITPSGRMKLLLQREDISVMDESGAQIGGRGKRSSEYLLHEAVYRARPDVNAVVHCHCPYLTAYALRYRDFIVPDDCSLHAVFQRFVCLPYGKNGTHEIHKGIEAAAPFVKPDHTNTNDAISLMYFTCGTTGEPKMVAHDFTYPLGHIGTGYIWHNLKPDSLHLTIADTGWGKAVWGKLYGQWIAGANVFVYDHEKFTPADILEKIHEYHITSLCAPPTIYRFLIREDLTKYDLSSLEYCTTAGEALNSAVYDTFKRLTGIRLMEGFGQTETTLTLATFPWMEPKPGSMGGPNPQYHIGLRTPDGRPAEDGEQGQIVVYTDQGKPLGLFKEYYRNEQLTREAWHDGIYYTGDVAWRDEDGYFWFVGRADDVIKSSGYRIGPFEVESALMTHPAVVECAITGVPDEIRGQVVKATIILGDKYRPRAGEELLRELQDHVKLITAPYKYPRIIEFVDELPKTISGKIRRKAIRADDENR